MSDAILRLAVHPSGEQPPIEQETALVPVTLDNWAGSVRVEWDPTAPLTPYGQLPFFIEYLKVACLFDALVADCPLVYTSPNAPKKRDVLGTTMLSVLAGHKRYAHITALRNDGVLPELLGMKKIVSEDAVRRGFKAIAEIEGGEWLRRHLDYCTAPLLTEPWVLDADSTIKPLYGHQEGAVLGYNPKSPAGAATSTTLTRWRGCAWCSMLRLRREMSTHPSMPRQDYGRSWIAFRAIAGRHFCAAIAASARRR
jgi:hypothetical protein